MSEELIKRMKDAIEGECDGLAITDAHAKAILAYVLEGSTGFASDADEHAAFEEAATIAEGFGPGRPIVSERPSDLIRGRREGEQAASSNIAKLIRERARAASTRAASETKSSAGEAECDAALRAAPASQHDVEIAKLREAAIALIEEPGLSFGNRVQVVNDFQRHADPKLIVSLIDRLSDTPAVDVEAERKLFEAKFTRPLGIVWTGKNYAPTAYGAWDVNKFWNNWTGWLAKARTQADAGKDAARYRYLRKERHISDDGDGWLYVPFDCGQKYASMTIEERAAALDAEIDAMLAGAATQSGDA